MVEAKSESPVFTRTVINPALNRWLKQQLEIQYLHEIERATIGNFTFEPQAGTHIKITTNNEESLKVFLEQFPTRKQRLAPYQRK